VLLSVHARPLSDKKPSARVLSFLSKQRHGLAMVELFAQHSQVLHAFEVFRESGHQSPGQYFRRKEGIVSSVAVFGTMKIGRNDKPSSAAVRGYIYSWRA
jgi:hypothetical protein